MVNLTSIALANNTIEQVQAVNTVAGDGLFMILVLVAMYVIVFLKFAHYPIASAFLGVSFIGSVFATLFFLMALIPFYVLIIALIMPLIGVFLAFVT